MKRSFGQRNHLKKLHVSFVLFWSLITFFSALHIPAQVWAEEPEMSAEEPSEPMKEFLSIAGITEPYQDVVLGLTIYGQIAKINFREGDQVRKGDVILEMDKKLEELEVKRRLLIFNSKAEVNSAAAHVAMLEPHLQATRNLYESTGSISKEELEKQELEFALAQAKHEQFTSAEDREHIEMLLAQAQLEKRILRAPFSGVISNTFLDVGESCEPDEPLVQLVDTNKFYFVCNVEEAIYQTLKLGQEVDLSIQSEANEIIKRGQVKFISPVVDPASGLRKLKVLVENRDGKIIPGVSGTMRLETE